MRYSLGNRGYYATAHRKIRKSCKSCKKDGKAPHSKNSHRFHGYGSFESTHISYCQKKECGRQDDPTVYRKAAKRRAAKRKSKK
jgi:hypothetical protein